MYQVKLSRVESPEAQAQKRMAPTHFVHWRVYVFLANPKRLYPSKIARPSRGASVLTDEIDVWMCHHSYPGFLLGSMHLKEGLPAEPISWSMDAIVTGLGAAGHSFKLH